MTFNSNKGDWGQPVRALVAVLFAIIAIAWAPSVAIADQGGISFWLPGRFGSLAALDFGRWGLEQPITTGAPAASG